MLRNQAFRVDNSIMHGVAEFFQGILDYRKGLTLVVAAEVFHVFQEEGSWLFGFDNASDVEK